jgi:hypothetical protein
VALVHNAPDGSEIEFQSEFIDPQDRAVSRTVTFDNYGTTHESLCEIKSLALLKSMASRRNGPLRRTGSEARPLGRFWGHLTMSISRFLGLPPSGTSLAARHDVPVGADEVGLNRTAARLPTFMSQSFDDSGAPRGDGRSTDLEVIPPAAG